MLDGIAKKVLHKPLSKMAIELAGLNITANQLSVVGFLIGMLAFSMISMENYFTGLILIFINRIFDGLDGKVAQINSPTDAGGFLDICLDFIFYSSIPLGFAIANPNHALAASFVIFSFVGTGSSFLAFSILAEKNKLKNIDFPNKSFYYLNGFAEGTETIVFFSLACLFPSWFNYLAYLFGVICLLTTFFRIRYGYKTLKKIFNEQRNVKKKYYNKII